MSKPANVRQKIRNFEGALKMASERRLINSAHGVTLTEISLSNNGTIVDRGNHVATSICPKN
jgi:hypothetical protein